MLREEPSLRDHGPAPGVIKLRQEAPGVEGLYNAKYGIFGRAGAVEEINALSAPVLLLYRRDIVAQAASWAIAEGHGAAWVEPPKELHPVTVDIDLAVRMAAANANGIAALRAGLRVPVRELAYEDISVDPVREAVEDLLGRQLAVAPPTTVKIAPTVLDGYVTNLEDLRAALATTAPQISSRASRSL